MTEGVDALPDPHEREAIIRAIWEARRILVITHLSPDGDAIGSLLGLGWALEWLGKECVLACADPVPRNYRYLPGSERVVQVPDAADMDLVISLDESDPGRMGAAYNRQTLESVPLANIDHHATNVRFGTWNWVDVSKAATVQLVLELVDGLGVPLEANLALCLLNGLVTDTRGFRTPNTGIPELQTAIRLMEAGASLSRVTHHALNRRPYTSIRLWGLALHGVKRKGKIIWAEVTQAMQQEAGGGDVGNGGLVNFLLEAEEANVAAVFTETEDGEVEVGLRSLAGVDVSGVALALGGGGHPQAAGCTVPGPLPAARDRVLAKLAAAIRDQEPQVP
ncbi:MAG: DHH family phosphoesterase [Anaerolineae bacterium]|mgnify:CR=1 FL=1